MIAKKYAKLLFSQSQEKTTLDELRSCCDAIYSNSLVKSFFSSMIDKHSADRILEDVLSKCKVSPLITKFLRMIAKNKRISSLNKIVEEYAFCLETANGQIVVDLFSAKELVKADRTKIEALLEPKFGKKILFKYHIDGKLIGGIIAKSGSLLLDASVSGALSKVV